MKIVFLNSLWYPDRGTGGAEASIRLIADGLAARGHATTLLTLASDGKRSVTRDGTLEVRRLPLRNVYWPWAESGWRKRLLRPLFLALEAWNPLQRRLLAAELRALRPDVVHAHNLLGLSASAWGAADDAGVPLVQTLHDYYMACPRATMWTEANGNCARQCGACRAFTLPRRRQSLRPAAVTAISHAMAHRIRAAGTFAQHPNVVLLRGMNLPGEPPPLPPRSDLPPGSPLRLGFLGRIEPMKGLDQLVDAVASLPAGQVSLVIGGKASDSQIAELRARLPSARLPSALQSAISKNGTGPDNADLPLIEFAGFVEPRSFLRGLDLLVVPSTWHEPLGRVVHEAYAEGVPVLVTPMGGMVEIVEHGVTGYLADAADASALARALAKIHADGLPLSRLQPACLARAREFAFETVIEGYEQVLLAAAARRPIPASVERIVPQSSIAQPAPGTLPDGGGTENAAH